MRFISLLILTVALFTVGPTCSGETKPNVVIFFIDDLGYNDVGCYGSKFYETPNIDKLAQQGDPLAFKLPEGRVSMPNKIGFHPYDSSFSGLKTAMLRLITRLKEENCNPLPVEDLCASFQATVAKALTKRAVKACLDLNLTTIAVGGGVAANSALREHLHAEAEEYNLKVYFPPLKYCTDNAAMIACAGVDHFKAKRRSSLSLGVTSRMKLEQVLQLYQ